MFVTAGGETLARFMELCICDREVDGSLARFIELCVCDRRGWISG